jgi:hypothetical protein
VLAHSLLSRNKSDCQTDYKLRNFGNRNYLHAFTKIQLNSVGVKISKMKNLEKLEKHSLNQADLANIEGGQSYTVHHNVLGITWNTTFVINNQGVQVDKYRVKDNPGTI